MRKTTVFSRVLLSCVLSVAVFGQDRHDWQSLSRLQTGDRVRVSLKTGPVEGQFQSWTPQEATFGTVTAKREVHRRRPNYLMAFEICEFRLRPSQAEAEKFVPVARHSHTESEDRVARRGKRP